MRWFSISGTASRKDALAIAALTLVLSLAVAALSQSADWFRLARWVAPLAGIAWAALIATLIRRLHDIGRNGAWVLLPLAALPLIGAAMIAALIAWKPARRPHQPTLAGAVCGGTLVGLVLVLAMASAFWRPHHVTLGDMKPSLLIGDRLLVRHGGAGLLERGDLVLIRAPVSGEERVLRLIGLAGDRIELRAGRVILNGEELPQQKLRGFVETYAPQGPRHILPRCLVQVGLGGSCEADRALETLPGGTGHAVLDHESRSGAPDVLAEVTVPAGSVYLLGDNRDSALDSRFATSAGGLGMVPLDRIAGRAELILFSSLASRSIYLWSWRPNRLLARIDRIEAE